MNHQPNDEIQLHAAADTGGETPPARKRAAKKAAAKSATKTAAKKSAGKEAVAPVAKKAAKKAAKKSAAKAEAQMELISSEEAPAPKKKAARVRKPAAEESLPAIQVVHEAPAPVRAAPAESAADAAEQKRFGRVPGGGPVVPREAPAPAPAREVSAPAQEGEFRQHPPQDGNQKMSRSKRRREKRKRRAERGQQQGGGGQEYGRGGHDQGRNRPDHGGDQAAERFEHRGPQLNGPKVEADGLLEIAPKGFGFLRVPKKNFEQARDDVFVTPESIRKYNLRVGQWIHGLYQEGPRGPQLVEITSINGMPPEQASKLPHFDELKAINPAKRISFETTPERFTTRVVDIMAPVGRGQRGLIVSPPRSGKTTLLLHMAEAIREKYDEAIHLMVLLVDERPEEVTEFRRALPGAEIYASSNDEGARNHCRIAEFAIERAKRLVEAGQDVFLLMDSITRLARAYNNTMNNRGRGTGSGGITIGALEVPRRLFAAARNTRGGGSLTIMATALIQTNSRADEAIFMEFKGTGNMELVLDRKIAENYIYPAVDIFKSGTRREELLIPDHMLHKIHLIRRGLSGHRPVEAMERLIFFLKKFPNNPQMLLEIKG